MTTNSGTGSVIPEISHAARNAILGILIGEVAAGFGVMRSNGHDMTRLPWLVEKLPGSEAEIDKVLNELFEAGLTEEYVRDWDDNTIALTKLGISWAMVHLEMPVWAEKVGRERYHDFLGRLYEWIKRDACQEFRGRNYLRIKIVD